MAIQKNVWAPKLETWPSVSTPTIAQIVKSSMSTRRRLFLSLLFSSSASAVVVSTLDSGASTGRPFPSGVREYPRLYHVDARAREPGPYGERPRPGSAVDRRAHALDGDAQVLLGN